MEALENSRVKVFASRKTDNWKTPAHIYKQFMDKDYFDPCPFMSTFDGLTIPWKEKNFVNPPYSQLKKWIAKAIEENNKGKSIIMLIPARTDTKAFEMLFNHGCNFYFVTGRLHFNDEKKRRPFP